MAVSAAAIAERIDRPYLVKRVAASGMEETEAKREPVVAVPLIYVQMLKGDARAALFLAQILFHQHSTIAADGWFWHTIDQWEGELGFSDEAEHRCCTTLKKFGLSTKVQGVNRTPKKHYHVDEEILQEKIQEYRHFRESRKCQKASIDECANAIPDSIDTSGKAVNVTTDKHGNDTSGKAGSTLPGKPEDLLGLKDQDLIDLFGRPAIAAPTPTSSASQKRTTPAFGEQDDHYRRALYLRARIHSYHPSAKIPDPNPTAMTKWREDMRLLITADKRTPEQAKRCIDHLETAVKWRKYVLSPEGLRRWADAILLEIEEKGAKQARADPSQPQARKVTFKRLPPIGARTHGGNDDTEPMG